MSRYGRHLLQHDAEVERERRSKMPKEDLCSICEEREAFLNFDGRLKVCMKCLAQFAKEEVEENDERRKSRTRIQKG